MPPPPKYSEFVYAALRDKVQGFDLTPEKFDEKIQDEAYRKNVYAALKDKVQGFDLAETDFHDRLKKKEQTQPTPLLDGSQVASTGSEGIKPDPNGYQLPADDPRYIGGAKSPFAPGEEVAKFPSAAPMSAEDELKLAQNVGIKEKPMTTMERVGSMAGAFNKPVVDMVTSIPKAGAILRQGIDRLTGDEKPVQAYDMYKLGAWLDKKALDLGLTATDERTNDSFLQSTVPSAFGSAMSFMLTGVGSSKVGQQLLANAPKSVAGNATKELGKLLTSRGAVAGGNVMGIQEFENAKRAGATDEQALEVYAKNYGVGQTEVIPIARALDRINKFTGGSVMEVLKAGTVGALEEGTQEGVQQYLTNKIAAGTYDPAREPFKDLVESMGAGMFVGFVLPGIGAAMQQMNPDQRKATNKALHDILKENKAVQFPDGDLGKQHEATSEQKQPDNAVQEQSTEGVLQHPQEGVGTPGGERGGVEPVQQGQEAPGQVEAQSPVQGAKEVAPQEEVVYHGGQLDGANGFMYVSPDKGQAEEYAKGNKGKVNSFTIDKSKIADEGTAREVIQELGLKSKDAEWENMNELGLHEILDNRFDTSLSDDDITTLKDELVKRGYTGVSFDDADLTQKNKAGVRNYVLFSSENAKPITPSPEGKEGEAPKPQVDEPATAPSVSKEEPVRKPTQESEPTPSLEAQASTAPAENRKKGELVKDGVTYKRQKPLEDTKVVRGKAEPIEFANKVNENAEYAVVEASSLQPSHRKGTQNPLHFIPEAQPKKRDSAFGVAGVKGASDIAAHLEPGKLAGSPNPYAGAPTINTRGEVIQGNSRADALQQYWQNNKDKDPSGYKKYLVENAGNYGLDPKAIEQMKEPVLTRMVRVSDPRAIELGQYTANDIETGGKRRIEPVHTVNKLASADADKLGAIIANAEGETLSEMVRGNTDKLLDFLYKKGAITETQLETVINPRTKEINKEGVEDVAKVIRGMVFRGQDPNLPQIFDDLPDAIQKGIDKAVPQTLRTPGLKEPLSNAIIGYHDYMKSGMPSIDTWASQPDMFNDGLAPSQIYSPMEIAMMKQFDTRKQGEISGKIKELTAAMADNPGDMFTAPTKGLPISEASEKVFGVKHITYGQKSQGDSDRESEAPEKSETVTQASLERQIRSLRSAKTEEERRQIAEQIVSDTGKYLLNRQGVIVGDDASFADRTASTFFDLLDEGRSVYLMDEDAKVAETDDDFKQIGEHLGKELPLVDGKLVFDDAFSHEVINAARELGYDAVRLMEIDGTNSTLQVTNFDKVKHIAGEDFVKNRQKKTTVDNRVTFERFGTPHAGTIIEKLPDGGLKVKSDDGQVYRLKANEVTPTGEKTTGKKKKMVKPPKDITTPDAVIEYNSKREKPIGIVVNPYGPLLGGDAMLAGVSGFMFQTDMGASFKKFYQKNFTSRGFLPRKAFDNWITRKAEISGYEYQIRTTIQDAKKLIKEEYGDKITDAQITDLNLELSGKKPRNPIPPKTSAKLRDMRAQVDNLTHRFINEGVVAGEMSAKFLDNLGAYLTRAYQKHDNPFWAEFVPPEVKNKAMAFLRGRYPGYNNDEIEGLTNYLISSPDAPMGILKGSKLGAMDLSILKKRGDIAPEIRALMGEYTDPLQNYARSVTKMASMIAKHHFLQDTRREALGTWMFEKPTGKYYARIASDKSKTMEPLNGLYTTPEIAKAFEEFNEGVPMSEGLRTYMKFNGYIKAGKTIFSVQTHFRNMVGNVWFVMMNGHWRLGKFGQAAQTAWANVYSTDQVVRDRFREYIELGVVQDSSAGGELRNYLEDIRKGNDFFQRLNEKRLNKFKNATLETTKNLYQFEDDMFKIFAFENEKARYAKAFPKMPLEELNRTAAQIVRDTYPTYSLVPKIVKAFRANPITGSFVSFPAEVIRTTINTIALMKTELANPATRSIGATRMAGIMGAMVVPTAMSYATMAFLGLDGDDDWALRRFMAPWQKDSEFLYLSHDGSKMKLIDLGYSDPHNYIKKAFYSMARADSPVGMAFNFAKTILQPFLSEEMVFAALIDVERNAKQNGDQVYNPDGTPGQIAYDVYHHLESVTQIGTIKSAERIYKAVQDKTDMYGNKYDTSTELMATFTGQRVEIKDIEQSLLFKAYELRDRITLTEKKYKRIEKNKEVTEKEKALAKEEFDIAMDNVLNDGVDLYLAAVKLGVAPDAAWQKMRLARNKQLLIRINERTQ